MNIFNDEYGSYVILYHGSDVVVEKPLYGYGKKENDFGRGFYCTENIELAREWSCRTRTSGYVNKYKLDVSDLDSLVLTCKTDYDLFLWYYILVQNRRFDIEYGGIQERFLNFLSDKYKNVNYNDKDIIEGFRADDSYFSYASAFLRNSISTDKLFYGMKSGKLGRQVVLKSRKAFDRLEFISANKTDSKYIEKYFNRDSKARSDYKYYKDNGSIFMSNILERGVI